MMPKVYILIVTYNGSRWYDKCFGSLRASNFPIHTVVVDNASTDNTVDYIKATFPEVELIESEVNLGFGQGNNVGIKYALENGADYVFLINQDVYLEKDTVEKLIDIHQKHPEYSILTPVNVDAEKKNILSGFQSYMFNENWMDASFFNNLYFGNLKPVYEIKKSMASSWFMSKDVFHTIGGFDPIFFHYGEDDNYVQRALYHKCKIGLCPELKIVHDAAVKVKEAKQYRAQLASRNRSNLLRYTDINSLYSFCVELFILIKRMLKLSFVKDRYLLNDIAYLLKQNKQIKISRTQNIKLAANYLK